MMIGPTVSVGAETTLDLKTADSFAILAGSTITNTGTTIIDGDVGLYPVTVFSVQGTAVVSGAIHIADAVALQTGQKTNYNMAMFLGSIAVMFAGAGVLQAKKRN